MRTIVYGAAMAVAATASAGAQRPSFFGTVARDTLEHMIGGAEIRIPALDRATISNYMGQFRFSNLPAGKYLVAVRYVGFRQLTDSIEILAGKFVERDYVLAQVPQGLDTVRTRADQKKWVSPALNAFEERRRSGTGGYFLSDSVFRANESQKLPDILGRIPGLTKVAIGAATYLASGRSIGNDGGPAFLSRRAPNVWCFVTLYIDGVKMYQAPPPPMPPDFARYPTTEYAAAEYYPGGASVPAQYNTTGSSCGVLLLWSRER
jgi:hypothetical protein